MAFTDSACSISTYVCCCGPDDRPFEETHQNHTLAVVRAGRFTYSGENGRSLLQAGSILLGNKTCNYACSHEDSTGDICTSLHFSEEDVAQAAAACGQTGHRGFTQSALPPLDKTLPAIAALDYGAPDAPFELLECVMTIAGGSPMRSIAPSGREQAAMRRAIDRIETGYSEHISLASLAASAGMSPFHFLRCFRKAYGTTPYSYLQSRRMAQAAAALKGNSQPITRIALDCGFTDLSSFNRRFKAIFSVSPRQWRLTA